MRRWSRRKRRCTSISMTRLARSPPSLNSTGGIISPHPELISILNSENLHRARHIRQSREIDKFASPQLSIIGSILSRGVSTGIFRAGITAESMFLTIAGLTYFYLSNIHTLSNYLSRDLGAAAALDDWLTHIKRVVIDTLTETKA